MHKGHARNMMTSPVTSVAPDQTIAELTRILASTTDGGVPVVSDGKVVGFVAETDVLSELLWGRGPDTPAKAIMSSPVVTIDEFQTTDEVIRVLREHRIHHLPVLRQERLVGMITPSHVVRFLAETLPPAPIAG